MKQLFTLSVLFPITLAAQTTWEVEAGGSTSGPIDPYYEPMVLVIAQGDIVHWEGVSGTHNVNGSLSQFPSNPLGFSSGNPSSNLDFSFTFNVPGDYMYHCTQNGHSATQHGMITVEAASNVTELTEIGQITLFPVPADGQLTLEMGNTGLKLVEVIAVDGRVMRTIGTSNLQRVVIDLDGMATGRYFLRLTDGQDRRLTRPFLKA